MSKKCINCGHKLDENENLCRECGKSVDSEEAFTSTAFDRLHTRRKERKKYKYINKLINKIILVLILLCIVIITVFVLLSRNSNGVSKGLEALMPKNQSSAYVLFQMQNIKEIQALRLNKADYYLYHDLEGRSAGLIVRYYINVNFNLEESSLTQRDDGSYTLHMKRPIISANLLDGVDYTEKKEPDSYPGVEIFAISNSWILGPDFQMGEIRALAQNYIDDKSFENIDSYTKEAFDNLSEKLLSISNKLKLNVTEIKLEGVDL